MQKQLFTIVLFLLSTITLAQKIPVTGYLITLQNDTIPGKVFEKNNFRNAHSIKFTDSNTTYSKEYTPEEIKGYSLGPNYYYASQDLTASFPGEKLFSKQILRGKTSLYVTYPKAGKAVYVLQKNDGSLIPLEEKKYFGLLKYNMIDCPAINFAQGLHKSVSYSESGLIKLITQYNQCISPQTPQTIYKRKMKINYGLVIGANLNNYRYIFGNDNYSPHGDYGWNTSPAIGPFFGIAARQKIEIELQLLYNYSTGLFIRHRDDHYYKDQIFTFEAHYVDVPLLFRFYFWDKIYLSPGLNFNYRLNQNGRETFMGLNYEFTPHPDFIDFGKVLGIGVKVKLFNRIILGETRINLTTITDGASPIAKLTTYQMLLRVNINKLNKYQNEIR